MSQMETNLTRPTKPHSEQAAKPRRFFPPLWLSIIVLLAIAAMVFLQSSKVLPEQGFTNMICMSLSMLLGLIVLVWFVFFSGFSGLLRFGLLLAVILGISGFFYFYKLSHFTGNMLPVFVDRFAPREMQTAAQNVIDLSTTSENDFGQFLGPKRNLSVENVKLARDWSKQSPKLLWKQDIGEAWSAFAVVNGYAVTLEQRGEEEWVTCYEVKTGKLQWAYKHPARYEDIMGAVGPRSTPTIHQGKVYALGATGILVCLDGKDGKLLWKRDLLEEFGKSFDEEREDLKFGRANSPLIVHDLVVVPAGGPSDKRVSLVAYNKDSGERVWTGGQRNISYSSPQLATLAGVEQILIVDEAYVTGHDPKTGKVLWEMDWPGNSSQDANSSQAVPVAPDRVFLSKGYGQGAVLVKLISDGSGTFTTEKLWHNKRVLRTKFTNVAIKDNFVYGLSDGYLECVNLETGKSQWKDGSYGHGQILRVSDLLLVLTEQPGTVVLVEANPNASKVLGSVEALEGVTWNNLALYGRYLLVRNSKQAACFELPLGE